MACDAKRRGRQPITRYAIATVATPTIAHQGARTKRTHAAARSATTAPRPSVSAASKRWCATRSRSPPAGNGTVAAIAQALIAARRAKPATIPAATPIAPALSSPAPRGCVDDLLKSARYHPSPIAAPPSATGAAGYGAAGDAATSVSPIVYGFGLGSHDERRSPSTTTFAVTA